MSVLFIAWLVWWISGFGFAAWAWTRKFDLEGPDALVSLALSAILGPIVGLIWLADDLVLIRRRKP